MKKSTMIKTAAFGAMFAVSTMAAALNLSAGWNLVGNNSSGSINVASTFADPAKVTTVWKWNKQTAKWGFYSPTMNSTALATYVNDRGYELLTEISAKEGYWINGSSGTVTTPEGTNTTTGSDLSYGWNLVVGTAGNAPGQLADTLNGGLNAAGQQVSTIWAWDNASAKWKFYSPVLAAQGGTALADYISSKGYKAFGTISGSEGIWVNVENSTTPPSAIIPPIPVKSSSYANAKEMNIAPYSLPTDEWVQHVPPEAYGLADFQQNGKLTMVMQKPGKGVYANYANPRIMSDYSDMSKIKFYSRETESSKWVDITATLLDDPTGCIQSRKAIVADFNGDGKPDVFFACFGNDGWPLAEGILPGEYQRVLLSQPNGKYKNVLLDVRCACHAGAAAELNSKGYADLVLTDTPLPSTYPSTLNQQKPFILVNNKDGTFSAPTTANLPYIVTTDNSRVSYYSVELIDFNGDGKFDLWFGGARNGVGKSEIYLNDGTNNFGTRAPIILPVDTTTTVLPIDVLYKNGQVYVSSYSDDFSKQVVIKIDLNTLSFTTVFSHSGVFNTSETTYYAIDEYYAKVMNTWIVWFTFYNNQIVPTEAAYTITLAL